MNVYLACPFSDPVKEIMFERFKLASKIAVKLMKNNINVYSPISYGYTLSQFAPELPTSFDFWKFSCLSFLDTWADELWVIQALSWELSTGVNIEIEYAKQKNIPVKYLDCNGVLIHE